MGRQLYYRGQKGVVAMQAQSTVGRRALTKTTVRLEKLGGALSGNQFDRLVERGQFPRPVYVSQRRPIWFEDVVDAHLAKLAEQQAA